MKIGFTGTRDGMTPAQQRALEGLLVQLRGRYGWDIQAAHGDCIGADAELHDTVYKLALNSTTVHVYPPTDEKLRAYCQPLGAGVLHEPNIYHVRNQLIVNWCDALVAAPNHPQEQRRGGTWYTMRYARSRGKRVVFVMPDGSVMRDQEPLL